MYKIGDSSGLGLHLANRDSGIGDKKLRYQKNWYKIGSDNSGMVPKTCGLGLHLATCWQGTLATCANVMCTTCPMSFSCQVIYLLQVSYYML